MDDEQIQTPQDTSGEGEQPEQTPNEGTAGDAGTGDDTGGGDDTGEDDGAGEAQV